MGRPASNGAPSFRFNSAEVTEMESILHAHKFNVPERDFCQTLAEKFSQSAERDGKVVVQMKQIWNWFQNRRYAIRAKNSRAPGKLNVAPSQRNDPATFRSVSQAPQHVPVPQVSSLNNVLQVPQAIPAHSGQNATKNGADNSQMEFEAKSSRDGAWYDVSSFLSHKSLENGVPAVLVRFAGFGSEEDEWINVLKNVRLRSLPCESSECVAVLPNDLILCFQEGKEQALYYDAHVLDAQRRRHDARGCRCRFLVRYDHDQSEEIVPLRKVCRRPETDYRLQLLHAESANSNKNKSGSVHHPVPVADSTTEKKAVEIVADSTLKQPVTRVYPNIGTTMAPVSFGNTPKSTVAMENSNASLPCASVGAVDSVVSTVMSTTVPVADNVSKQVTATTATGVIANTDTVISLFALTNTSVTTTVVTMDHSNAPSASAMDSDVSTVVNMVSVDDSTPTMNQSDYPLAPTSLDSGVSVSVANTTVPKQPENTLNPMAEVPHASTDVNVSMVPDSHTNASLSSASAGAVDSTVSTENNVEPTAFDSMPNHPSSTGADANTCKVAPSDAPSSSASETNAVDLSVALVANTGPVHDSSISLTCTVGPVTLDASVITEATTSMEKLGSFTTIDNEGNLNSVDTNPGVAVGANNISDVPEEPSGANSISNVPEDPSGANNTSDAPEEPSGVNNISNVPEEPTENMQIG